MFIPNVSGRGQLRNRQTYVYDEWMRGRENFPVIIQEREWYTYRVHVSRKTVEVRCRRDATRDDLFFVDCEGHKEDGKLQPVLDKLEAAGNTIKLLGSYPKASEVL